MTSKSSGQSKAPDPTVTADAQGAVNADTARLNAQLNRVNQYGPGGSVTYSNNGDNWTQSTQLSPAQQQIYGLQQGIDTQSLALGQQELQRVGDSLATPFNYDGIAYAPNTYDFSADRDKVEQDYYNRGAKTLDDQYDRQDQQLQQNLADRGIGMGNAGYTQAYKDFDTNRDNAYDNLRSDAIQQGGAEQSRLYGLAQSSRQEAIQERAYQQNLPLQQLATILGYSGGVQMPQFSSVPQTQAQAPDYQGAVYNSAQVTGNNAALQASQQNALYGGLAGLGAASIYALA
jgi:hypothetical protein